MKLSNTLSIIFLLVLLVACGSSVETTVQEDSITSTPIFTQKPNITSTPLPSETSTPNLFTPTATLNPTQQIWLSTAIVISGTQNAINQQKRNNEATLIPQFPNECENTHYEDLSPDAKWLARNCGNENAKTLKLQNREDVIWTVEYTDLFGPNALDGESSSIQPIFWDLEGNYVYLTSTFGGSGGGDQCFSGYGTNGLFRLNLKTGFWVVLVPPKFFPGNEIKFSPTGRRYAVNLNGITVNDLNTGDAIQINTSGVMEFIWSPDGTNLAYSVSRCDKEGFVIDASLYIWDVFKNQSRLILRTEKTLLYPDSWNDISRLIISSKDLFDPYKTINAIYEYDIPKDELIFIGPYSIFP